MIRIKCNHCGFNFPSKVFYDGFCPDCGQTILDSVLSLMPAGSGFNYKWEYSVQKNKKIKFSSRYAVMNDMGYYLGGYPISFTYDIGIKDFKVFCSVVDRISCGFSEYFKDTISDILPVLECLETKPTKYFKRIGAGSLTRVLVGELKIVAVEFWQKGNKHKRGSYCWKNRYVLLTSDGKWLTTEHFSPHSTREAETYLYSNGWLSY